LPDVRALVAFGKLGMELAGSKILSLCALFGVVAIAAYSVYAASYIGAVCSAILAACFAVAVKAESKPSAGQE